MDIPASLVGAVAESMLYEQEHVAPVGRAEKLQAAGNLLNSTLSERL